MSGDLVDPVIGESFRLDPDAVVGLILHRVTCQSVDAALAEVLLVVQSELTKFVNVIHGCRPSNIVCGQRRTVGRSTVTPYAHRTIIEIAVIVPLLSEPGLKLQILKDLVSEIDIEIVP